jgi:hypothetical protein
MFAYFHAEVKSIILIGVIRKLSDRKGRSRNKEWSTWDYPELDS